MRGDVFTMKANFGMFLLQRTPDRTHSYLLSLFMEIGSGVG